MLTTSSSGAARKGFRFLVCSQEIAWEIAAVPSDQRIGSCQTMGCLLTFAVALGALTDDPWSVVYDEGFQLENVAAWTSPFTSSGV